MAGFFKTGHLLSLVIASKAVCRRVAIQGSGNVHYLLDCFTAFAMTTVAGAVSPLSLRASRDVAQRRRTPRGNPVIKSPIRGTMLQIIAAAFYHQHGKCTVEKPAQDSDIKQRLAPFTTLVIPPAHFQ